MIIVNVQCDECQATCKVEHDLDEEHYKIETCPFCGSEDLCIECDESIL